MASRFASVTSEEMMPINFCGVYYLTVLVYTKTTIHLSVGGQWWPDEPCIKTIWDLAAEDNWSYDICTDAELKCWSFLSVLIRCENPSIQKHSAMIAEKRVEFWSP